MEAIVARSVTRDRFSALILGAFGCLAVILAAVGIYGVIAYSVARRTHEIGVRMALGAASSDVLSLVVREGLLLAVTGVAVGLAGSAAVTRLMSSLLVGVAPNDPAAFVAAGVILIVVAVVASYVPARRAVRVDPITALRAE